MAWLIYEGGELVGKSTLARAMVQATETSAYPYTYLPLVRPKKLTNKRVWNEYVEKEMVLLHALADAGVENLILDRVVWASDNVYGEIFRGVRRPELLDRAYKLPNIEQVYIWVSCPYTKKQAVGIEKEEKFELTPELHDKIYWGYYKLYGNMATRKGIRIMSLDTTFGDAIHCHNEVVSTLQEWGIFNEKSVRKIHRTSIANRLPFRDS